MSDILGPPERAVSTPAEREQGAKKVRTTCGRCGVYRDLHPTRTCEQSRYSFWWDRHWVSRHLAARAWLALSDNQRMFIVSRLHRRRPHLCWCDFVDSALLDDKRDDYECGCDAPLPIEIAPPRSGCYCSPPAKEDPRG